MDLRGKKVLVFGSGISGIGAADLLLAVQAVPVIYDGNETLSKEAILGRMKQPGNTEVLLGGELTDEVLDDLALVVVSPGIPMDIAPVLRMKEKGLPIWGEVELAYQMSAGREILAVTGTNGKTTTTALLGEIMKDAKGNAFVVGNIGIPYTSVAREIEEGSVTVAEISSFQLETTADFHPVGSAITNITEDHLNRHHTMEEYIRVKELITENQTAEDFCVLNYEDEILRAFGETIKDKVQVVYFSSLRRLDAGIFLEGDTIIWKDETEEFPFVKTGELKLLGLHNFENVMVAAAMAYMRGVPVDSIRGTLRKFAGVEHRIEYVTEKNGVAYYNDSKGTNPDAAIKGIQAMNRPTYLIGGGYDKESSYEEWINSFDGKVRCLVLIGQTREKIAEAAARCGFTQIVFAENLKEAVEICAEKAVPGEAVLLSPACASWGQFDNYEQRGDCFKEYVCAL